MPYETEAKFRVRSLSAVGRILRAAAAEYLGAVLETDDFFDTPKGKLQKGDRALRLRTSRRLKGPRAGDLRCLLTFKGPRKGRTRVKRRLELQTHLDDGETAEQILLALGMRRRLTIQKRRAAYRLGPCLILLDELPLLGSFVEIEGPNEKAIRAARRKLKLPGDPITKPYTEMLTAHCKRLNANCRAATFERCADCRTRPQPPSGG